MGVPLEPIVSAQPALSPAFWMNAANAAIRSECGWHVAPIITETLTLDGSGGVNLLLPSRRVRSVLRALNNGVDVTTDVHSSGNGILELPTGWTRHLGAVEIEIIHGYAVAEVADVAGVIAAAATRGGGMIRNQSVASGSVGYAIVELLESEKRKLDPYRLNWGA